MIKEQIELLGKGAIAVLPNNLQYCFDNLLDKQPYRNVQININNIEKMGKFWKFITGTFYIKIDEQNNKIILNQPSLENNKACMVFLFYGVDSVDAIFKNGTKKNIIFIKSVFQNILVAPVDFDYDNPIRSIVLHFFMNIADDLEINIDTLLVSKPIIDENEENLKKAEIRVATGESLINVYFKECSTNYKYTKVELYILNLKDFNIISKRKVEEDYFCSFDNLAFGNYGIKVIQFDNNDKILAESKIIKTNIERPNYSGKPIINMK